MLTDVLSIAGILFLRFFVLTISRIRGRSMQSALMDKEWVLVWRWPYLFHAPRRHDVVVCHYPNRWWRGIKGIPQPFIKRVIGLPGETLEIIDGVVHINGEALAEDYLDPLYTRFPRSRAPVTLGADEFFVMGDHRDNSHDSRSALVGPLKRRAIVGRAACTLWPLRRIRRVR